ncbi:MAG: hypothetical protein EBZ07_00350 [Verrucomicrobia bacterium]|nr:hypothetical protein [Verrucomicrobiota bacterium]
MVSSGVSGKGEVGAIQVQHRQSTTSGLGQVGSIGHKGGTATDGTSRELTGILHARSSVDDAHGSRRIDSTMDINHNSTTTNNVHQLAIFHTRTVIGITGSFVNVGENVHANHNARNARNGAGRVCNSAATVPDKHVAESHNAGSFIDIGVNNFRTGISKLAFKEGIMHKGIGGLHTPSNGSTRRSESNGHCQAPLVAVRGRW